MLARNPDSWMAHNNLGFVLTGMPGLRDEAMQHLEQAVRLNPADAEAQMNLGVFLAEAGHLEEAVAHYRAALEIYPTYAVVHNDLGAALSNFLAGRKRLSRSIGPRSAAIPTTPRHTTISAACCYTRPAEGLPRCRNFKKRCA
ncbi:MAG: tetratricopeptide repeat protein [Bryobacterales bacterium]|nr:tetratricopeptide repeat protein [Bryobacterales bacterium]MBV9398562.1 tetratricopeptide repeat protein [Bryobacterales bacterium]